MTARTRAPGTTTERLARELVDEDANEPLADELGAWMADSRRFRAFAVAHRDKIRKKLRGAADTDARRDVRTELAVAHHLLADPRIELAFEAYGSTRGGPDFTLVYRGEGRVNVEVTRLHGEPALARHGGPLLTKLHQLPPSVPNVILIAADGERAGALDVAEAVRGLRARADSKDEAFFATRGFVGTRGFYDRFLRLGSVLVWCEGAEGEDRAVVWANRSARIPVSERITRALLRSLRS